MNRKRKFYEISNSDEDNIEKIIIRPPINYDKRTKVKDISNDWLVDSKIANEFKRKSQIKKKSSHIRFSNSKSKMNSSLKTSLLKKLMFMIRLVSKSFKRIQVALIRKRVKKCLRCSIRCLLRDSRTCRWKLTILSDVKRAHRQTMIPQYIKSSNCQAYWR